MATNPIDKILKTYLKKTPFLQLFDIKIENAKVGSVELGLSPVATLMNHFNTYQAGVYYTLAEVAGGLLCGTFIDLDNNLLITQESSSCFFSATNGPLRCKASIDNEGIQDVKKRLNQKKKTQVVIQSIVFDTQSTKIFSSKNTYYLRLGIPKVFLKKQSQL